MDTENLTSEQLIARAIKKLVSDARHTARRRKTTLKQVSKHIFDDTRTLDALAQGRLRVSIERAVNASRRLKEMGK